MAEGNIWERKENLKNPGEALEEFEGRMNAEIRRQKKIDMVEDVIIREYEQTLD